MEALVVIAFIYFILNSLFVFVAECVYFVFGDEDGDAILAAPLLIGLIIVILWLIG